MLLLLSITDPVEEFEIVNKLLPEMIPEHVRLFVDDVPIKEAEPIAMLPPHIAAVELLLVSAPVFETPLPFIVKLSVLARENPPKSSDAPFKTLVAPAVEPNGPFGLVPVAPSFKVPELTVVAPEYVLFPDSITELEAAPVFIICSGLAPLIVPDTVKIPVDAFPDVPM